jgi:16S rRNA (guanine527-N7)-methyltransferase
VIAELEAVAQRPVSRETFDKLQAFGAKVAEENKRQNLISASTLEHLWDRHILDSAQLVRFEPKPGASWVDIGSGAGLPGVVIACLVEGPVTLIEPRRLRAAFLERTASELDLRVIVHCAKAERITGTFGVISARAVASLSELLRISQHLSTRKTVWALPKGRNAQAELAEARRAWQGAFHVEPCVTDAQSFIVVGTGVRAR